MEMDLTGVYTLILATLVLLLGSLILKRVKFLRDYNIPEPVVGGIIAAIIVYALRSYTGWFGLDESYSLSFKFDTDMQNIFMLMFFTSIGLGADFARLKAGGIPLVFFVLAVGALIVIQDVVGVGMASMLGLKPLMGLVTGSITLTGGHGNAGSWGGIMEDKYGIDGAITLGMAVATFGLVSGGLVGGPVAHFLIHRINARKAAAGEPLIEPMEESVDEDHLSAQQHALAENAVKVDDLAAVSEDSKTAPRVAHPHNRNAEAMFTSTHQPRLITSMSTIETLTLFALCIVCAMLLTDYVSNALPTFVWSLFTGILVRNVLTHVFKFELFDRAIDVIGNACLSLYLAIALLNLNLWQLTDLAGPVMIILAVQIVVMVLFAIFVTFVVLGRDYDAAVLAAGHCGFGLGATPTAIANMQAITDKFGPSPKAYLLVPMVGAFFDNIINSMVVKGFLSIPFLQ